jgi:hypothetical protein
LSPFLASHEEEVHGVFRYSYHFPKELPYAVLKIPSSIEGDTRKLKTFLPYPVKEIYREGLLSIVSIFLPIRLNVLSNLPNIYLIKNKDRKVRICKKKGSK